MNTQKFLLSTLAGGVTFLILGFLIYGVVFMSFFQSNMGSVTGATKDHMEWWALIVSNLAIAALLAYIFMQWAGIKTFTGGAKAGAILGLLMGVYFDLIMYATTNLSNLTGAIVDILLFAVMTTIVGGIVGLVIGMGKETA